MRRAIWVLGFVSLLMDVSSELIHSLLRIRDVPGFEFILIHCGNTQADTSGYLLVGTGTVTGEGNMSISGSRFAPRRLYAQVVDAAESGSLEIEFMDNDR